MKLREAVTWLPGTLQRNLIPRLDECGERPLTEQERQLVSILELVHIEKFVGGPAPRKKGPRRRGEVRAPKPETRLERQCRQSAAALAELPVHGDVGGEEELQGL
jgi:hypothetical protein